jgi:hypothetical protein
LRILANTLSGNSATGAITGSRTLRSRSRLSATRSTARSFTLQLTPTARETSSSSLIQSPGVRRLSKVLTVARSTAAPSAPRMLLIRSTTPCGVLLRAGSKRSVRHNCRGMFGNHYCRAYPITHVYSKPLRFIQFLYGLFSRPILRFLPRHNLTPLVRMHGVDGMIRLSFLSCSFFGYWSLCRAGESVHRAVLSMVEAALSRTHEGSTKVQRYYGWRSWWTLEG